MTSRADIEPSKNGFRRLSYTCRCGWVDWGHALPGNPLGLKEQMDRERASWPGLDSIDISIRTTVDKPAFVVVYGQSMGSKVSIATDRHWVVAKGLTVQQRERVALGIFLAGSMQFERLQGSFPFSIVTKDSSFSPEDLVSNLIGFYSAFRGKSQAEMKGLCEEVGVKESYKVWDDYLPDGLKALKNPRPRPILFSCESCDGKNQSFPSELEALTAEPPGNLYIKTRDRFIDGRLVNARIPLVVDLNGVVGPKR